MELVKRYFISIAKQYICFVLVSIGNDINVKFSYCEPIHFKVYKIHVYIFIMSVGSLARLLNVEMLISQDEGLLSFNVRMLPDDNKIMCARILSDKINV